jgi:dolichol-phosphate mannosyltransferase
MEFHNGFSIIIPTYHEAKNVLPMIDRIANVNFGSAPFEVVFMDDNSQDGIEDIVKNCREKYPWVRLIVRQAKKDLSQSVIDGFHAAKYPILLTLDADLSHPPEKIPEILTALEDADVVLGSRYVPGGSMDEIWPLHRKIASRTAALIARILLNVNLKDPLSGLVAIRKKTLQEGDPLEIVGWKWGLELMIKCHCKNIKEVPIHFSQRRSGYSKLTTRIVLRYFQHVNRLIFYKLFLRTNIK